VQNIDLTQEYRGCYGVKTGLFSFGGDVFHGPKNNQTAESYQLSSVNIKMGLNGYQIL
jgi:hypothetical protein